MSSRERNGLNRFKKVCMVTLLAAGMLMGVAGGAKAIDFKAKGEWLVGFGVGEGVLTKNTRDTDGAKSKTNTEDQFGASQRIRLQLDAVASEALSGTVYFEIGDQQWGKSGDGAALGADGNNQVKVKNAYIDWLIPQTDARVRMQKLSARKKTFSLIHSLPSTRFLCIMAICPAGPPKLMNPSLNQ